MSFFSMPPAPMFGNSWTGFNLIHNNKSTLTTEPMRKEIYFLTRTKQRVYLSEIKHPATVQFLGRQPLKRTYQKYYAGGFTWLAIQRECKGLNRIYFFANDNKNTCIYSISNDELSRGKRIFNRVTLAAWKLRAWFKRKIK